MVDKPTPPPSRTIREDHPFVDVDWVSIIDGVLIGCFGIVLTILLLN